MMIPIRTILHPTDFSEYSESAFQLAGAIARDYGARLIMLHVETPPPGVSHGEMQKVLSRRDGYRQELEERLRRLPTPGLEDRVDYVLAEGNCAEEILTIARQQHCDLIVIGTHGRTGMAHLMFGSVSEEVLRKATCPVLVVKTPLREMRSAAAAELAAVKS